MLRLGDAIPKPTAITACVVTSTCMWESLLVSIEGFSITPLPLVAVLITTLIEHVCESPLYLKTHVHHVSLQPVTIGSSTLGPPARTKQFLISPPTSPPVGWTPVQEESPSVDYNLLAALSRLRMGGLFTCVHT